MSKFKLVYCGNYWFCIIIPLLQSLNIQADTHISSYNILLANNSLNLKLEKPQVSCYQSITNKTTSLRDTTQFQPITTPNTHQTKQWIRITAAPALFFAAGAFSWSEREKYRETRNRYVSDFSSNYDDYMQYVPALSVYGLNMAGIKGKHTVGRATTNFLYGQVIMAITVTVMKNSIHVQRPDGSSDNSFPSGHTATAFSGATFLHKEYGQYRDPMYSVFGYTMAAATGMGRQLNNRHWISDVLVGAGIGILSTELGYVIANKLHDKWGVNASFPESKYAGYFHNPSFLEVKLGTAWSLEHELSNEHQLDMKTGFTTSLEGAYFFNRRIGLGGEISFSSFPFATGEELYDNTGIEPILNGTYTEAIGTKGIYAGVYTDFPLSLNWSVAAKINPGYEQGVKGSVWVDVKPEYQDRFGERLLVEEYKTGGCFAITGGMSLRRTISKTVSVRAFVDYSFSKPSWNVAQIENLDIENGTYTFGSFHQFDTIETSFISAGLGLTAIIW